MLEEIKKYIIFKNCKYIRIVKYDKGKYDKYDNIKSFFKYFITEI